MSSLSSGVQAAFQALGQVHFLFGGQQRHAGHFFEIQAHRVVGGNCAEVEIFFFGAAAARGGLGGHLAALFVDVNAGAVQEGKQLFELLVGFFGLRKRLHDIVGQQEALCVGSIHQDCQRFRIFT